jgi:hypothetical protein
MYQQRRIARPPVIPPLWRKDRGPPGSARHTKLFSSVNWNNRLDSGYLPYLAREKTGHTETPCFFCCNVR